MKIVNEMTFAPMQLVADRFYKEVVDFSLSEWLSYRFEETTSKTVLGCSAVLLFTEICAFFTLNGSMHIYSLFCLSTTFLFVMLWFFTMVVHYMHIQKNALLVLNDLELSEDTARFFIENFERICLLDHYLLEKMCNFDLNELEQTVTYYRKELDIVASSVNMFHVFEDTDKANAIVFALSKEDSMEFHRMIQLTNVESKFDIVEPELHLQDAKSTLIVPNCGRLFK